MALWHLKRAFTSRSRWRFIMMTFTLSFSAMLYSVYKTHNSSQRRLIHQRGLFSIAEEYTNKRKSSASVALFKPRNTNNKTKMQTHIRFLKVHKAGSTTMQNMLFRFGLRHDLNVLLAKNTHYMEPNDPAITVPKSEHFDIFACHSLYSKKWFDSILPKDSVNIAIVRNPTERIISAAYYYRDLYNDKRLNAIPRDNFIHNLVQHPEYYESKTFYSRTKNAMGKDFGFKQSWTVNDTRINDYLRLLDNEFLLVMVLERLNESLVLLRRLLNWSLLDILYLRTNTYKYDRVNLEPWEVSKLKKTSYFDYAIYDFFQRRLQQKINKAGRDFYAEVDRYVKTLENVDTFCKAHLGESLEIEESPWSEKLTLPRAECELMVTSEMPFIQKLRARHARKYPSEVNDKT